MSSNDPGTRYPRSTPDDGVLPDVDASRRVSAKEIEDYLKRYEEASSSMQRFVMVGNAGGAIAALSLIGTTLARAQDRAYPLAYFFVLLIFVVGLVGSWAILVQKTRTWGAAVQNSYQADGIDLRPLLGPGVPWLHRQVLKASWINWEKIGTLASMVALATGTIAGLVVLASLAR